jgi:hypothetical protein
MRRVAEFMGAGLGYALGFAFVALQIGPFVGGISYRKECVTERGEIKKSWSFTWLAPIPYLFRPSEPGCVVHTGTRVALNQAGVATFAPTTVAVIANKEASAAEDSGDSSAAYVGKVRAATTAYVQRNNASQTLSDGQKNLDTYQAKLSALTPPQRYADAHAKLLAVTDDIDALGGDLRTAIQNNDSSAANGLQKRAELLARRLRDTLGEIDRLRATE